MRSIRVAVSVLVFCSMAVLAVSVARAEPRGLERWQEFHPEAARELGEWVRGHRDAAHRFFEWDAHHTERAREFVGWSIEHPMAPIVAFSQSHPGWPEFNVIVEQHRPAAEAFMGWARRNAEAARELMNHPGGLQWAGNHLYQDSWHMDHPYRSGITRRASAFASDWNMF